MTKAQRAKYDAEVKANTQKAMFECKKTLTTAAEGSEEWEWARIGYNECADALGLPHIERPAFTWGANVRESYMCG